MQSKELANIDVEARTQAFKGPKRHVDAALLQALVVSKMEARCIRGVLLTPTVSVTMVPKTGAETRSEVVFTRGSHA